MNKTLLKIIYNFQSKVQSANDLLKKYLKTDEPHNWGPPIDQVGLLGGKYKYFFHGIGCAVHISDSEVVDFDYGYNGRVDGFDHWRLWSFVDDRQELYPNIKSEDIKKWLSEALQAGEIERPVTEKYGSLYFLVK